MGAASDSQLSGRRYRRRILGWGAVALVVTFAVGSAVTLARVEDDLSTRVDEALAGAGVDGVTASFSGQDGTLRCDVALDAPDDVVDVAGDVRGVRTIELDPGCTAGEDGEIAETAEEATTTSTTTTMSTTTTTLPDPATIAEILVDDPQFSVLENAAESVGLGELLPPGEPVTVFAPTDDAFAALGPNFNAALASDHDALAQVLLHHVTAGAQAAGELVDGPLAMLDGTTVEVGTTRGVQLTSGTRTATVIDADLDAIDGVIHVVDEVLLPDGLDLGLVADEFAVVARYDEGRIVVSGAVADAGQRDALVAAATTVLAAENVVDEIVVDADAPVMADDIAALVALIPALAPNLVSGEAVVAEDGLFVTGIHVDASAREVLEAVAADVDAVTGLTERPTATEADAAELEERLNALVDAEPITFEPASAALTADTPAVLDRVAALAKSLGGVVVVVEGHTDSDGAPADNLALSTGRAQAVVGSLAIRGVPVAGLEPVGIGSERPVLVDGAEDKAASRRVEFVVVRE